MKWCLNIFLKYFTPSVALRDSGKSSPLYMSASPTSRFFSSGPRFVSSSTVKSNQSSINSSYLNQDVDPSKSGGIFVVIPLPAVFCHVDSARYAPINDTVDASLYSDGKSPKSSSPSLIVGIVEVLKQHPLTRDLARDKILYFYHATTALHHHFVVVGMFFLWKPHVTRYN